ncbi:unnamed protein product, partial [Phaeothamnion confervicola]
MLPSKKHLGGLTYAFFVIRTSFVFWLLDSKALPFLYVAEVTTLVTIRFFVYYRQHWHHFLLDFCYVVNACLVLYIVFFPKSQRLFVVTFGMANGTAAWGGILFRNALQFHDLQKMTSCYIHLLPATVCYALRWMSNDSRYALCRNSLGCPPFASAFWHMAAPVLVWCVHALLHGLWVFVMPHHHLRSAPGYTNTFLYL